MGVLPLIDTEEILGPPGQECCDEGLNWKMLEIFGDQDFGSKVTLPWESVF